MMTEKIFRDPIHHDIRVDHDLILDLINSKEFQRLRRIKQLGTSSLVFHTAEHTRFGHSLGVYEITRQICNTFSQHYNKLSDPINGWDDRERIVTLCAALLHDIGHGPFSHTFEGIFNTNHEQFTIDIITSDQSEVFHILKNFDRELPEKVSSVIKKTYHNPQVVQLISSQIDADRMDYLLRDAYFTGTEYGLFDLTRIFRVIQPHKEGIVFKYPGMHAVEDYIVSRYQMYMQVYFHPVSSGMEVVLKRLLQRAQHLYAADSNYFEMTSPLLVPFLKNEFTISDYLDLDDGVLTTAFHMWQNSNDSILNDLSKRFLNRIPFKSISFNSETEHLIPEIKKKIASHMGFDSHYYISTNSNFNSPYDTYIPGKNYNPMQINLLHPDGTLVELSEESELVATLAGKLKGGQRVYFPEEMLETKLKQPYTLFEGHIHDFKTLIHNEALKKINRDGMTHDN